MVPVDDEHTMRLALFATPQTGQDSDLRLTEYFRDCTEYNAADHHRDLFAGKFPTDPLVRLTSAQDYVVLVGQGRIADRVHERLGQSDAGIALLRKMLWRELEAVTNGGTPKAWRKLERPSKLFENAAQA
jgi:hypothetical protein